MSSLRVVQYRMRQAHHLAVRLVGAEYAGTNAADVFGERHHEAFAYGVDGGVGHLGELLAEVVEQQLRTVAQHRQRRVVAHRRGRLLPIYAHRDDGVVDVFGTISEHQLVPYKVADGVVHLAAALQFLQLNAVGGQPLTIRMLGGEPFLYFSVIVNPALLRVDKQNLARLQAALLGYLRRVEVHHAHLRRHHHHVVLGYCVARRAQSVTVEHAAGIASVAEEQRRRTVPRFHQNGVILVKRLQIFRYWVLVVEALGHH